jgi:signal transduction histidine kinase
VFRPVAAAQGAQKAVLVLIPLQRGSSMSMDIDSTIRTVLNEGLVGHLDYYTEYLDVARFPEPDYEPAVRDFFRRKYASRNFDVVLATTNAMVDFVNKYRDELFPGAAVVYSAGSPRPGPKTTGVLVPMDLKSTIDIAIQLHPDLRHVFVVSGVSEADRFYQDLARAQFRAFDGRLDFTYSSGLAMPDLFRRLADMPPHTIVYFLSLFDDGHGSKFSELKALDQVAAVASVPTYSWVDSSAGHGHVGGSVLNVEGVARLVANAALRVLKGESPESIPTREIDGNVARFDWRQLHRWGISETRLPTGSLVKFREPSFWDQYKFYITGATSVLVLQTVLIAGLLVHRARRRRVENALRESEAALRVSNDQNQDLAGRLITAQEDERRRIARDLHDDFNQRLALLSVQVELLSEESDIEAGARSGRIAAQLRELSSDVHKLSHQLHPVKVEQLGLVTAAQSWCDDLAKQSGLRIEFSARDVPADLESGISLCLYRVIQESLRNVVRHSHATAARVELTRDTDGLRLTITDEGQGFDVNETTHTGGIGLVSMQERMRLLHGTIAVSSNRGQGTKVEAMVPLLPTADVSRMILTTATVE